MEMLSGRGTYNGREFFSPQIVEMMQTNFSDISGVTMGLGWELNQPRYMGDHCTPRTIGKTGFTGCVCLCDLAKQKSVVLLSNYTFPKRKADASLINSVRKDVADIVFSERLS